MRQGLILVALVGYASAVKWEADSQAEIDAALAETPLMPDFDPATVVDWWQDVYTPLLTYHAYNVANTAWQNLVNDPERAPLTEVCEEGQECRNKVDKWMQEEIQKTWEIVLNSLKTEIESTTMRTQTQIEQSWKKKIECEVSFPCCEYDENQMKNVKLSIADSKKRYRELFEEWETLEKHRKNLIDDCPGQDFPTCDEHNATPDLCWDSAERLDDFYCTCDAMWVEPMCGVTECPEKHDFNSASCGCDAQPEEEKEEEAPAPVFACPDCPEGMEQVGNFPMCQCEATVTECDVCWDGSVPDVATDPDCTCPERKVEFSLKPDEGSLQYVVNPKKKTYDIIDWPENISINNPVKTVCWGEEWCYANFFTADGDMYSHLTPDEQHNSSDSICTDVPTSGLTKIRVHYAQFDKPDSANFPDTRWRLNGIKLFSGDDIVYESFCTHEYGDGMADRVQDIELDHYLPPDGVWVGLKGELQEGRICHATQFRFAALEQP